MLWAKPVAQGQLLTQPSVMPPPSLSVRGAQSEDLGGCPPPPRSQDTRGGDTPQSPQTTHYLPSLCLPPSCWGGAEWPDSGVTTPAGWAGRGADPSTTTAGPGRQGLPKGSREPGPPLLALALAVVPATEGPRRRPGRRRQQPGGRGRGLSPAAHSLALTSPGNQDGRLGRWLD